MEFLFEFVGIAQYFLLGLAAVLIVVGVVFRVAKKSTDSFVMRSTSTEAASGIVAGYVDGITDYRFAFPSGLFRARTQADGQIVFRESVFGTVGFAAVWLNLKMPFTFAFGLLGSGNGILNLVIITLLVFFVVFIALPMTFLILSVTIVEIVVKQLLRSTITAHFRVSESNPADSMVTFELRGPSALLCRPALEAAFASPRRPIVLAS